MPYGFPGKGFDAKNEGFLVDAEPDVMHSFHGSIRMDLTEGDLFDPPLILRGPLAGGFHFQLLMHLNGIYIQLLVVDGFSTGSLYK